jgi:predicted protein tyrosine phosphatase
MPIFPVQQIAVCCRDAIEQPHCSRTPFVLISIRDSKSKPVNVTCEKLVDAIYLVFDDISKHIDGLVIMNDKHAIQIADFVIRWHRHPLIVCQCEAGISRSAGVAAAIMNYLGGDDELIFNSDMLLPNIYVYDKIRSEFLKRVTGKH